MSKLLVPERPLLIIPSLALKLGLNEAVVLQQIHYWLEGSQHQKDGRKWVYNTYKEWQAQLPFWSESTIKRTIKSLEQQGYLISANYNRSKLDQTKWYSIDYEKLRELDEAEDMVKPEAGIDGKVDTAPQVEEQDAENEDKIPYAEVITYLNQHTQSVYRVSNQKTRKLILARWKEGFTLDDFRKVIDLKTREWLNDPKWSRYLRPETLFGSKFESYLNQKPIDARQPIREEDFNLDDEA
jgi:uncharacterized phage protein (TIGR02220 family)